MAAGSSYPPPYAPDLNPIEMAFSKPEAHLRRIGARSFTDMVYALAGIRDLYSPQECWNDLEAEGYVSSQKPDGLFWTMLDEMPKDL